MTMEIWHVDLLLIKNPLVGFNTYDCPSFSLMDLRTMKASCGKYHLQSSYKVRANLTRPAGG